MNTDNKQFMYLETLKVKKWLAKEFQCDVKKSTVKKLPFKIGDGEGDWNKCVKADPGAGGVARDATSIRDAIRAGLGEEMDDIEEWSEEEDAGEEAAAESLGNNGDDDGDGNDNDSDNDDLDAPLRVIVVVMTFMMVLLLFTVIRVIFHSSKDDI